ncbi:MAG: glutaredoxin family protein [Actinomycetia bacterium]|nr:glutaredoxin family protein [Actinomycetes bacterium]
MTDHAAGAPPAGHRVTFVTRPGCHLCDIARPIVAEVCGELGVPWEERDITADPELYERWWEQIPVTLVDGAPHDFWAVDRARLRAALSG